MDDPKNIQDLGWKIMIFTIIMIWDFLWSIILLLEIFNFSLETIPMLIVPLLFLLISMGMSFHNNNSDGMKLMWAYKLFSLLGAALTNIFLVLNHNKFGLLLVVCSGILMMLMLFSFVYFSLTSFKKNRKMFSQNRKPSIQKVDIANNKKDVQAEQKSLHSPDQQRHVHFPKDPITRVLEFIDLSNYLYVGRNIECLAQPVDQMSSSKNGRYKKKNNKRKHIEGMKHVSGWDSDYVEMRDYEGQSTSKKSRILEPITEEISVHVEDECAENKLFATSGEYSTLETSTSDRVEQNFQRENDDEKRDDESYYRVYYSNDSTDSEATNSSSSQSENM